MLLGKPESGRGWAGSKAVEFQVYGKGQTGVTGLDVVIALAIT